MASINLNNKIVVNNLVHNNVVHNNLVHNNIVHNNVPQNNLVRNNLTQNNLVLFNTPKVYNTISLGSKQSLVTSPSETDTIDSVIDLVRVPIAAAANNKWAKQTLRNSFNSVDSTLNTFKDLVSLNSLGETLDALSNPIKGAVLDRNPEKGFVKGLIGQENYNYDTGNVVTDLALEIISDPANWVSFGGKALGEGVLETGSKTIGQKTLSSLDNVVANATKQNIAVNKTNVKEIRKILNNNRNIRTLMRGSKGEINAFADSIANMAQDTFVKTELKTAIVKELTNDTSLELLRIAQSMQAVADSIDRGLLKLSLAPITGGTSLLTKSAKQGIKDFISNGKILHYGLGKGRELLPFETSLKSIINPDGSAKIIQNTKDAAMRKDITEILDKTNKWNISTSMLRGLTETAEGSEDHFVKSLAQMIEENGIENVEKFLKEKENVTQLVTFMKGTDGNFKIVKLHATSQTAIQNALDAGAYIMAKGDYLELVKAATKKVDTVKNVLASWRLVINTWKTACLMSWGAAVRNAYDAIVTKNPLRIGIFDTLHYGFEGAKTVDEFDKLMNLIINRVTDADATAFKKVLNSTGTIDMATLIDVLTKGNPDNLKKYLKLNELKSLKYLKSNDYAELITKIETWSEFMVEGTGALTNIASNIAKKYNYASTTNRIVMGASEEGYDFYRNINEKFNTDSKISSHFAEPIRQEQINNIQDNVRRIVIKDKVQPLRKRIEKTFKYYSGPDAVSIATSIARERYPDSHKNFVKYRDNILNKWKRNRELNIEFNRMLDEFVEKHTTKELFELTDETLNLTSNIYAGKYSINLTVPKARYDTIAVYNKAKKEIEYIKGLSNRELIHKYGTAYDISGVKDNAVFSDPDVKHALGKSTKSQSGWDTVTSKRVVAGESKDKIYDRITKEPQQLKKALIDESNEALDAINKSSGEIKLPNNAHKGKLIELYEALDQYQKAINATIADAMNLKYMNNNDALVDALIKDLQAKSSNIFERKQLDGLKERLIQRLSMDHQLVEWQVEIENLINDVLLIGSNESKEVYKQLSKDLGSLLEDVRKGLSTTKSVQDLMNNINPLFDASGSSINNLHSISFDESVFNISTDAKTVAEGKLKYADEAFAEYNKFQKLQEAAQNTRAFKQGIKDSIFKDGAFVDGQADPTARKIFTNKGLLNKQIDDYVERVFTRDQSHSIFSPLNSPYTEGSAKFYDTINWKDNELLNTPANYISEELHTNKYSTQFKSRKKEMLKYMQQGSTKVEQEAWVPFVIDEWCFTNKKNFIDKLEARMADNKAFTHSDVVLSKIKNGEVLSEIELKRYNKYISKQVESFNKAIDSKVSRKALHDYAKQAITNLERVQTILEVDRQGKKLITDRMLQTMNDFIDTASLDVLHNTTGAMNTYDYLTANVLGEGEIMFDAYAELQKDIANGGGTYLQYIKETGNKYAQDLYMSQDAFDRAYNKFIQEAMLDKETAPSRLLDLVKEESADNNSRMAFAGLFKKTDDLHKLIQSIQSWKEDDLDDALNSIFGTNTVSRKLMGGAIKASDPLAAFGDVEKFARSGEYIALQYQGLKRWEALAEVINTHFDYAAKTSVVSDLELLFPFLTFPLENLKYWAKEIEKDPVYILNMLRLREVNYKMYQRNEYELENNSGINYNYTSGNIMLGGRNKGQSNLVLKLNPSMYDALNMIEHPLESAKDRFYFSNIKSDPVSMLPGIGPAASRLIKSVKKMSSGDYSPAALPVLNTIFGKTYNYKDPKKFTPYTKREGYWYDKKTNTWKKLYTRGYGKRIRYRQVYPKSSMLTSQLRVRSKIDQAFSSFNNELKYKLEAPKNALIYRTVRR